MSHVLVVKLYDLGVTELADISGIALECTLTRRLNQARAFTVTAPAGHELLTAIADDGYPNLRRGNRKLLVWEDGTIIFHGRVWITERNGDGTQNTVTITAYDPWMELGYDADDRAGRPVRDATGNFIHPTFTPSVVNTPVTAISGADLIQQALKNSQGTGTESDPNPGEGPLPIDITSGSFDLASPPAVDLSVIDTMDWPVLIGDFVITLVMSNVLDVDMRPVEPGTGINLDGDPDDYIMVELSVVSDIGTDRSADVHFDYWTGDFNASKCRHVADFSTICNKLYDYLAPHKGVYRFKGNITPGSPGTTVDPSASRALYGSEFMAIRILDSVGTENSKRPLFIAGWNAEQGLRDEPREMLFITPSPDVKALFELPADADVGDLVATNIGAEFGLTLSLAQRIYGYDKTWDRQRVARITNLITSADAE